MRLFTKIFLCSITVITAALAVLGYVMISGSFESALERERQTALAEYGLLKFALQSGLAASSGSGAEDVDAIRTAALRTLSVVPSGDEAAVLTEEGEALVSTFPEGYSFDSAERTGADELVLKTERTEEGERLTAIGRFSENGTQIRLVLSRGVSPVFEEKHLMERRFFTAFWITELVGAAVMAAFSFALTKPINRLTRSTRRFARGKLKERTEVRGNDEISELSVSFNSMAETIEDTIRKLELSAKQKDDFTASFAHELKTPLTSVIGYADMIYQRKDLTKEEVREAAGYILNEGMRLEALSLKLMELIVLEKQDFPLIEMPADEAMADVEKTVKPMLEKRGAELACSIERAYIRIEFDLFKTLVLNLIDNAAKAGAKHVRVTGALKGGRYGISVADDGRGIPEDQLERITEAFYMVDKSRSRKEHGAGLGLAIASRIAGIHGAELRFESELGKGTVVSFDLEGSEP